MVPKADDRRKYNKRTLSSESLIQQSNKRARLDPNVFDDEEDIDALLLTPLEANEQFILENLTLEKAVYLIFTHIPKLPSVAPNEFIRDYATFVTQGNIGKIHLANVLAQQFIEAKVGPGVRIEAKQKAIEAEKRKREKEEEIKNEKVGNRVEIQTESQNTFYTFGFRLQQQRRKKSKFKELEHLNSQK